MKGRPEQPDREAGGTDWAAVDDAALARRVAGADAGADAAAETELYRRLAPRARLYGLRHLRDRHAAADLAQQVTMMTLERVRKGELRDPARLGSFVLGMCRMVVLDLRRTDWRRERLLETYADDVPSADPAISPRLARRAVPPHAARARALGARDDVLRRPRGAGGRGGSRHQRRQRAGDPAPGPRAPARLRRRRRRGMTGCASPVDAPDLLAYWLGELDEARETRVEEHVLGCAACAAALDALVLLGAGVRDAFTRGAVSAVLAPALVQRLAAAGYRLREYRVPANGSVNCTAGPDDDLVVARLQAPLADVGSVDLVDIGPDGTERLLADIPFDAATGEVVLTPRTDLLKRAGDHLHRMRLVDAGSRQVIAEYAFVHAAWRD